MKRERGRLVDRLYILIVANNKHKNNQNDVSQQQVPSELFHYQEGDGNNE